MKKINYPKSMNRSKSRGKSKDQNRGKSKSRSKSTGRFKLSQKSVLLTYPRTDKTKINKVELGNYLFEKFNLNVVVVAEEHHKDGNPHLHAWLEFKEVFNTRNCREFDYKNHHCNIGKIENKEKNTRENALTYLLKEDKDPFCLGLDIKEWYYNNQHHRRNIAEDLLNEKLTLPDAVKYNPKLLYDYGKIKSNLGLYKIDTKPIFNENKTNNNIWIYGLPRTGKSFYAFNNYQPYYNKPQTKWWDGYNNEDNVIIDDLDTKSMEFFHYLKIWADNYDFLAEIKNGTIKVSFKRLIVTSNYLPEDLIPKDPACLKAIKGRFNFKTIIGKFPNYTLVDLDNYH